MKTKITLLFILILSLIVNNAVNAQDITTKQKLIRSLIRCNLYEICYYTNESYIKTTYKLDAINDKYQSFDDWFVLFNGSRDQFREFVDFSIKFLENNDPGTSISHNGYNLSLVSALSKNIIIENSEGEYHVFRLKELKILKDKITELEKIVKE